VVRRFPGAYWHLRGALRGWEEPELALLDALVEPDAVAVDVGANYGMYTHRKRSHPLGCRIPAPKPDLAEQGTWSWSWSWSWS
jgi:hypothetical protein